MDMFHGKKPQLIACAFMVFVGLISTIVAIWALSLIGLGNLLPIKQSMLLTCLLALLLGSTKHSTILKTNHGLKRTFFIGAGLFLMLLPLFDIGAVFMMKSQFSGTDNFHASWSEYFTLYVFVLIYSFLFIGSWLSIISGLLFVGFNQMLLRRA